MAAGVVSASTMGVSRMELGELDTSGSGLRGGRVRPPRDVCEWEIDRSGPHGCIMKCGLQDESRSDLTQEPNA
jgi:hypothetical protein